MKSTNTLFLSREIDLYNNPFKLSLSILGNELEKNCYVLISISDMGIFGDLFHQGQIFATKNEAVHALNITLRAAVFNCEKVSAIVDNIGPGDNGRYLTMSMVEKIISTLQQIDTWSMSTTTKNWKKMFLTKEDGLVEGQEVLLTYLSGENEGEAFKRKLDFEVKSGFSLHFEGQLRDDNIVKKVRNQPDGSFLVETKDFICSMVIIEK